MAIPNSYYQRKEVLSDTYGIWINVAPLIMKIIVKTVLEQDELMKRDMSAYINDIYVNEDTLPANEVRSRLESFGLSSKDPTQLRVGATVMELKVWVEYNIVEVRELSSGTLCYIDIMHNIFHMWEESGTFSYLWVAPYSHRNDKKNPSKHGNNQVA